MLAWEYRTVDMSKVAFGRMPRVMEQLNRRGWYVAPVQPTGDPLNLRVSLRRPIRLGQIGSWLWLAG